MNRTMTVKSLIVTIALSGLTACAADAGGEEDLGDEYEPSVAEDELRLPGKHHHNWWWWWWKFHHRADAGQDAGRDAGAATDSGTVVVDSGTPEVDSGTPEVDSGTPEVDSGTPEVDSGTPEVDSGTPEVDSGTPEVDSGTPEVDSGTPEVDSGTPEVDSGTPEVDSGTPEVDSGTPEVDSGTPEVDSGTPEIDSGTPEVDSGTPEVDSGTPVVDSGTGGGEAACTACREANCTAFLGVLNLVTGCFTTQDTENGNPTPDPAWTQQCTDVVTCARQNGCGEDPILGAVGCYCGTASANACANTDGAANGACIPKWQAAGKSTVNSELQTRFSDLNYPVAWAYYLLECDRQFCSSAATGDCTVP